MELNMTPAYTNATLQRISHACTPAMPSTDCTDGKNASSLCSPLLMGCDAGMLLKEMIEDLEWTAVGSNNSTVEVCLQRQPRRLLFIAQAAGSLQVSQQDGRLAPL